MEPLAAVFMLFAGLGLCLTVLDLAAYANDPTPSMYIWSMTRIGLAVFVICGILSLAAWAS